MPTHQRRRHAWPKCAATACAASPKCLVDRELADDASGEALAGTLAGPPYRPFPWMRRKMTEATVNMGAPLL